MRASTRSRAACAPARLRSGRRRSGNCGSATSKRRFRDASGASAPCRNRRARRRACLRDCRHRGQASGSASRISRLLRRRSICTARKICADLGAELRLSRGSIRRASCIDSVEPPETMRPLPANWPRRAAAPAGRRRHGPRSACPRRRPASHELRIDLRRAARRAASGRPASQRRAAARRRGRRPRGGNGRALRGRGGGKARSRRERCGGEGDAGSERSSALRCAARLRDFPEGRHRAIVQSRPGGCPLLATHRAEGMRSALPRSACRHRRCTAVQKAAGTASGTRASAADAQLSGREVNCPQRSIAAPRTLALGWSRGACEVQLVTCLDRAPDHGALTSIMPVAVRAENCGRYMSSTLAAGCA